MSPMFPYMLATVAVLAAVLCAFDWSERRADATYRAAAALEFRRITDHKVAAYERLAIADEQRAILRRSQGCTLIAAHYEATASAWRDRIASLQAA
jgi:hypothetical protein